MILLAIFTSKLISIVCLTMLGFIFVFGLRYQYRRARKSRVLYVDSKYGDNSRARPDSLLFTFKTISGAQDKARKGDTIWVLPGTYYERVIPSDKSDVKVFIEKDVKIFTDSIS